MNMDGVREYIGKELGENGIDRQQRVGAKGNAKKGIEAEVVFDDGGGRRRRREARERKVKEGWGFLGL